MKPAEKVDSRERKVGERNAVIERKRRKHIAVDECSGWSRRE